MTVRRRRWLFGTSIGSIIILGVLYSLDNGRGPNPVPLSFLPNAELIHEEVIPRKFGGGVQQFYHWKGPQKDLISKLQVGLAGRSIYANIPTNPQWFLQDGTAIYITPGRFESAQASIEGNVSPRNRYLSYAIGTGKKQEQVIILEVPDRRVFVRAFDWLNKLSGDRL